MYTEAERNGRHDGRLLAISGVRWAVLATLGPVVMERLRKIKLGTDEALQYMQALECGYRHGTEELADLMSGGL